MKRTFLSNLAFLILLNILIKPFWIFGIDRTVQNMLGAEVYGSYFVLFNFSFLFSMLLDFGISNFNKRAVARHENLLINFLPNIFLAKWILAAGYMLITFALAMVLGFGHYSLYLLAFLALNQILISFIAYFRSNISAMHFFKLDAILSVLDKVLMIILFSWLIWFQHNSITFKIEYFVWGQSAAYLLTAIIASATVLLKTGLISIKWNQRIVKLVLKHSFPFALLGLLMTIYNRIDAIMIERMLGIKGAREAGIYAASYRILDAVNMIGFSFATILLPMFSRMMRKKEPVQTLVNLAFRSIWIIALCCSAFCFFYAREIISMLYAEASPYWSSIFSYLMLSFMSISSMYIFGTLLAASGKLKEMNYLAVGGVLANVLLNAILIIRWNALGATWATLITQSLVAIAQVLLCYRFFKFSHFKKLMFRILYFSLSVLLVFYASTWLPFHWILNASVAIFLALFLAVITQMFKIEDWKIV